MAWRTFKFRASMNSFRDGDDPHNVQYLLSLLKDPEDQTETHDAGHIQPHKSADRPADTRLQVSTPTPALAPAKSTVVTDVKYLSASQALPYLRRLSRDAQFLRELMRLKRQQDELEQSMAQQRKDIMAETTSSSREAKLANWKPQCLERWDDMVCHQQRKLQEASVASTRIALARPWQLTNSAYEQIGLPGFYSTTSSAARDNQRQVLNLLSDLIDGGDGGDV